MRFRSQCLILLLSVLLVIPSVGLVTSAIAQTIPQPSVPEFTVRYADYSYNISPTYGIDPYSGKTVQTGGGFTIQNKSIELTIKTTFTSYKDGPH